MRRYRKKRTVRRTVLFDKRNDRVRRTGDGCDAVFTRKNRRPIGKREGREKAGGIGFDDDDRPVRKAKGISFDRIAESETEKDCGAASGKI